MRVRSYHFSKDSLSIHHSEGKFGSERTINIAHARTKLQGVHTIIPVSN